MKTAAVDQWTVALWEHYLPSIRSGGAFYLAADSRLIWELHTRVFAGRGGADEALQHFNCACHTLLCTSANRAALHPEALNHLSTDRKSRAICLAVQQVLVVELMLQDDDFSERSYFPRYREVLQLTEKHTNPLGTDAFQEIWNVLREELVAVPGATGSTITFSRGAGKDLSRNLPLSQALLTTHDLRIVRTKAPSDCNDGNLASTLRMLRDIRNHLGTRARRLIANAAFNEMIATRLHTQVQSFFSSNAYSNEVEAETHTVRASGSIVAYLERLDLFDVDDGTDSFSVYLRANSAQVADASLESALRRTLARNPFVLLSSREDAFCEASRDELMACKDAVLAILPATEAEDFRQHAAQQSRLQFVNARSNLPNGLSLLVCNDPVGGRLDMLLGYDAQAGMRAELHLEGGLLVDARTNLFLAGYPPTGVQCKGRLLCVEDVVVNGVPQRVDGFFSKLQQHRAYARYELQFGAESVEFVIATSRLVSESRPVFGYSLVRDELNPCSRPLAQDQACLRGTLLLGGTRQRTSRLSNADLVLFATGDERLAVSEETLALVLLELRLLGDENTFARQAAAHVRVTKSVPLKILTSGLLSRLQMPPTSVARATTDGSQASSS